ncbi:hypothetical protein BU24DRAFT_371229, partial [Aaosphaeria arxii CBS 175.79]
MVRPVTDDDIGLKVLRKTPGDTVDIVAIHGIGAHPDDTWCKNVPTAEGPRWVNWLSDEAMLPAVAPHARIMRYGYESRWFGEGALRQNASTVAQRLLLALGLKREENPKRPLIFIAHCFGGLVVLKALVEARHHEIDWPDVFASTTGLIFLGTPFRGTDEMSQTEMLEAARREYEEDDIQPEILRILEPGNEILQDVVESFGKTRRLEKKALVACFYELKPCNVGKIVGNQKRTQFVVNKSSGCLDISEGMEHVSLSRTHFDMNKFGKSSEEDFQMMAAVVKKMVKASNGPMLARSITSEPIGVKHPDSVSSCNKAMTASSWRNFRLRGIPMEFQRKVDVCDFIKNILSMERDASLVVHSLAVNPIDGHTKVATLSFDTLPASLSNDNKNEWVFGMPENASFNGEILNHKGRLVFDTHFSGFTPLHDAEDDCYVDVIAISGPGDAFDSFQETDGPFMWLRDALPLDLPKARIFIYGYNIRDGQSDSFTTLATLGREFEIEIQNVRRTRQSRPIVFIGHGVGGLLIKEAVVQDKKNIEGNSTAILDVTNGFLFFGVPHLGLAAGSFAKLLPNHSQLYTEGLKWKSVLLQQLESDFKAALGPMAPEIISYLEIERSSMKNKRTDGVLELSELSRSLDVIVNHLSATCGSHLQYPVDQNHSELVKFSSEFDILYSHVKLGLLPMALKRLDHDIRSRGPRDPPSPPLSQENIDCLRSLSFQEQDSRFNKIHVTKGTCSWFLDDLQTRKWINNSRGLFWVKGNPGAGKSALMKSAFAQMNQMNQMKTDELLLRFFIHGRGTFLQKSPLGTFRALLNSMLSHFPEYLSELTEQFEDREKRVGSYHEKRWDWDEKELRELMSKVLVQGTHHRSIIIFVDALDEYGEDLAKEMVRYFKDLMKDVEREKAQVKICFSSRHYPILGHDEIPAVLVENRNEKDIKLVTKDFLKDIKPVAKREQFEKEILRKAQGSFQWAVLVATIVREESIIGTKADRIAGKLASIPKDLDGLYTEILRNATDSERDQMIKLSQWILFSERPLSALELRDALATDQDMAYSGITELKEHEVWVKDLSQFETRIKHISRGLVEFQTPDVWEQYDPDENTHYREAQFIHQSVADFILNNVLNDTKRRHGSSYSEIGIGHYQISRSCLRYLAIEDVLQGHQLSRGTLSVRFPLAPYAVRFLFKHIQTVEQERIPQLDLLSLIQWAPQSEPLQRLAHVWKVLDPNSAYAPIGWPFVKATSLHVSVAFGSKSALMACLQEDDGGINSRDSEGNTPLLLAMREHHQDLALALLDWSVETQNLPENSLAQNTSTQNWSAPKTRKAADINAENKDGETPLTIAVTGNAEQVFLRLIELGADL